MYAQPGATLAVFVPVTTISDTVIFPPTAFRVKAEDAFFWSLR